MDSGAGTDAIDAILADWAQGDVLMGSDIPALRLVDLATPLTTAAADLVADEGDQGLMSLAEDAPGIMIVSQTCDLVRSSANRPFVQVCPLVPVDPDMLDNVKRGRQARFVYVAALEGSGLVADLEQILTVEKAVIAAAAESRLAVGADTAEARRIGQALANKLARTAFPDAFTEAVSRMRDEIVRKHDKTSPMGAFLRGVLEIRVRAEPNWSAAEAEIELLFVFERTTNIPPDADERVGALVNRFQKSDAYPDIRGRAVALDALTALTYRDSDRLDLDHLSEPRGGRRD